MVPEFICLLSEKSCLRFYFFFSCTDYHLLPTNTNYLGLSFIKVYSCPSLELGITKNFKSKIAMIFYFAFICFWF